jgi:hypothetical protein
LSLELPARPELFRDGVDRRTWSAALALVPLLSIAACASAQVSARVDADLEAMHRAYVACRQQEATCPPQDVLIDAVASGDVGALRTELVALGMRHTAVAGRIVSGRLPVPAIPCLVNVAALQFARPSLSRTQPGR